MRKLVAYIFLAATITLSYLWPASAKVSQFTNSLGTWRNGCENGHCYVTIPIELTAQPNDIFDFANQCANSPECVAAIAAAVQAAGGDGAAAAQYTQYYAAGYKILKAVNDGNQNWIYFWSAPGFSPCHLRWNIYSANSSVISATFLNNGDGVVFYANVPHKGFTQGRSWIKAFYEIDFIGNGKTCTPPGGFEINSGGIVYQNLNDPNRPAVNGWAGAN